MHMEANLCKNIEDSLEEQPQSESFMDGLTVQLLYIGQEGEEPINNLRATGLIKYVKRILSTGDKFQQVATDRKEIARILSTGGKFQQIATQLILVVEVAV